MWRRRAEHPIIIVVNDAATVCLIPDRLNPADGDSDEGRRSVDRIAGQYEIGADSMLSPGGVHMPN